MVRVGCEPRLDYSDCDERYHDVCPIFYLVVLLAQGIVFIASAVGAAARIRAEMLCLRAPHTPPPWKIRIARWLKAYSKDTILQMRFGTLAYSFWAVLHHASLMTPSPLLPHLLVEYAYNFYNIALIATIATTLRYWREFTLYAASSSGVQPPALRFGDRILAFIYSLRGCIAFVGITSAFCLITDTWGLLSDNINTWRRAVLLQHFFFMGVCSIIAVSCLRIGYVQETFVIKLLHKMSGQVKGDGATLRDWRNYKLLFRFAFLTNGLVWVACFVACGVGGVFFDTFYLLAFWVLLFGLFNVVGLLFAVICGILSLPALREAELRLFDILAYAQAAKKSGLRVCTPSSTWSISVQKSVRESSMAVDKHYLMAETLDSKHYPCYVMSIADLRCYSRLPTHEEAMHDGRLQRLTKMSYWPCRSYTYFISQTWIDPCHPDGVPERGNPKLRWMQTKALELLGSEDAAEDIFLWMDIFSIPQNTREYTMKGIMSLPSYVNLVGGFIPLVRDLSDMEAYQRRGWCMLECICALTPKLTQLGAWRMGPHPSSLRYSFFGNDDREPEDTWGDHRVELDMLKNPQDPRDTDFTVEDDRLVVLNVQRMCAELMFLYLQSDTTSWEHTCDLRRRPPWLRARQAEI